MDVWEMVASCRNDGSRGVEGGGLIYVVHLVLSHSFARVDDRCGRSISVLRVLNHLARNLRNQLGLAYPPYQPTNLPNFGTSLWIYPAFAIPLHPIYFADSFTWAIRTLRK